MVTFTLPEKLCRHFFTPAASDVYQLFAAAATSGFTMVLHTVNQRLTFYPVRRYLRHVLPCGMRSIRYNGFCHSAAKVKRERIAFHSGRPLQLGALALPPPKPAPAPYNCPFCGGEMKLIASFHPSWRVPRGPPPQKKPPSRAK